MASQQKNIESKEMVVGQILSHKRLLELAGKPKEKEKYVMAKLGVSKVDSLDKAAKILGDLDPKFITQMNLAALLFSDWNDPVTNAKKVHHQLKRIYSEEREGFLAEFGFKLPYIEFLRQEATGRGLNCLKSREMYNNFEVSREDVQRNISLPALNYESCVLLAGYWGKASLKSRDWYVIQLSGGKSDFDFYRSWVKDTIKGLHNLEVRLESVQVKGYETEIPRISIGSRAIATWLKYDLGFPKPKENVDLPDIEWNEERKQGFFDGIIAFMGGCLGNWGDLALHDHDLHFIRNLSALSKELGYTPNVCVEKFEEKSKSYRLYFSPNQVKRMSVINPKHRQKGASCTKREPQ